jgi:hypothetical protein
MNGDLIPDRVSCLRPLIAIDLKCSVCHAHVPDEGDDVWRPGLCRWGRRSLGGPFER